MTIIDLDETKMRESLDLNMARIKAYHCTRGFQSDIASEGLKQFNYAERVQYFRRHLRNYGVCEKDVESYLDKVREFLGYEEIKGRAGKVCFFLNRGFFEEDDEGDQFLRYFGGEAMYRVAESNPEFDEVKTALESIGQPLIVTAAIDLGGVESYQRDRVLERLRGESTQNCEAFFAGDIPPSDILDIEVASKPLRSLST